MKISTDRFDTGSLVYLDRRTLRHKSEPDLKKEEALKENPWSIPHVYADFTGATVKAVCEQAAGQQGIMVSFQKVVRDGHTLAQVQAWRAGFAKAFPELLAEHTVAYTKEGRVPDGAVEIIDDDTGEAIGAFEPFVVLRFVEAGSALSVEQQVSDMAKEINAVMPAVYAALLKPIEDDESYEVKVRELHAQILSMSAKK